ncbi:MAG: GspH/FimT family pseudopilin [Pseudomonadota bacterium]
MRRGFSLVELMMVLAIAAVLLGLASPDMRNLLQRRRLDSAVTDLYGAVNLARSQAIARGSRVQLVPLEPAGVDWSRGWVVFVDANGDRRPGPNEEVIASHQALDAGIVISFNFSSNKLPYYVAYNSAGRSCSDTSSAVARWGTLSLHQDGQIRRIRINMLGRARICNPQTEPASCTGPE